MRTIRLPAETYDYLYWQGLVHGGIGAGRYWKWVGSGDARPYCGIGCLRDVQPNEYFNHGDLTEDVNDRFVRRYNKQHNRLDRDARVPVDSYFKGLNITRMEKISW